MQVQNDQEADVDDEWCCGLNVAFEQRKQLKGFVGQHLSVRCIRNVACEIQRLRLLHRE